MTSSTSSSENSSSDRAETRRWRRFLFAFLGVGAALFALLYGFVAAVDPWGMLPGAPRWHRIPISTNARFAFPMLADDPRFDAAIVGTSTSRLLRPDVLDPRFGAHFVNLAMNSATPWEQSLILGVFLRRQHRDRTTPRAVILGLDAAWCLADGPALYSSGRPIPLWMYGPEHERWTGYFRVANLYALQEAANQFMWLIGRKKQRYGSDGYTDFLPPEGDYDRARVAALFRRWGDADPAPGPAAPRPAMPMLRALLDKVPAATRLVLYLPPSQVGQQGVPGSAVAARWAACRQDAAAMLRGRPHSTLVDFDIPSAITATRDSFWDPIHYRVPVANRVMDGLARAAAGGGALPNGIDRVVEHQP